MTRALALANRWRSRPRRDRVTAAAGRPPGGASAALLIIVGEEDVAEVGDIADVPAERVPGAIKRIVAGADQLVHVAKPERFNQLARDFSTSEG